MISEVEQIKARLDIVEVVGRYVELKKAGTTYKANCPFHSEKTPSFVVSPGRQTWHCFGACGTGGDVVSFVMRREALSFKEALVLLAEQAGVRLPERRRSREDDKRLERLRAANEMMAEWYRWQLLNGQASRAARDYLERRGVDISASEAFTLGYSLLSWQAGRERLRDLGFSDAEALAAGLLASGDSGLHDRFRGRLMFPIRDITGRVAGFGARALDDSGPKYLNTSQTAVFDKGAILYGMDRASEPIRREGQGVIAEGYMDVIAAHQFGFTNVVGSMGTSLTERQVRLLRRSAPRIVLALDADAAGSEAMVRSHDVVREAMADQRDEGETFWQGLVRQQEATTVELRVVRLPEGMDPDDVIRRDPQLWRRLIAESKPVLDYRLEAMVGRVEISSPQGRSQLVGNFLPLLAAIGDPVVRANYLQRLSRLASVNEGDLMQMLAAQRGRKESRRSRDPKPKDAFADSKEEYLLALLLRFPDIREEGMTIPPDLLSHSENQHLLEVWKAHGTENINEALPEELISHLERLINRRIPDYAPKEARDALVDCRRGLEKRNLLIQKQAMTALLAGREQEFEGWTGVEAGVSPVEDEQTKEVVDLFVRDMETGLKLHGIERNDGGETAGKSHG